MRDPGPQPPPQAGATYLADLSLDMRRRKGLVYTPDSLVRFILDLADYTSRSPIEAATLLDPACGAGAFLGEALQRLAARWRALGHSLRTRASQQSFLSAARRQLFGVDVDPTACELARLHLHRVAALVLGADVPTDVFTQNVMAADSLTATSVDALPPMAHGGFALVVGNPPYVSATRIGATYKQLLRHRFRTATGRVDLYMVFMERAIEMLRPGGRLAFITPDKFLLSRTAAPLRAFILQQTSIHTIARFSSHKVFTDAATVPCISILDRLPARNAIRVLDCRQRADERAPPEVRRRATVAHSDLADLPWDFVDPMYLTVARRLQRGHATLESKMLRVSAGPATGRDGIYVVPDDLDIEPELLQPIARGRDILPFQIATSGARIIVPYSFAGSGSPRLVRLSDFPKAKRYLERHRHELEQRHCVRVWEKAWYEWHDQPSCDIRRQTKILVPDVAQSNRFAVDTGRFLPLHSVYYLIPRPEVDPFALAAILNSKVAEFIIRLLSPTMKDGFSRYRQQFLATIPVPNMNRRTVAALARAVRDSNEARMEELVAGIFSLTDAESAALEQFLVERAPPAKGNATRRD